MVILLKDQVPRAEVVYKASQKVGIGDVLAQILESEPEGLLLTQRLSIVAGGSQTDDKQVLEEFRAAHLLGRLLGPHIRDFRQPELPLVQRQKEFERERLGLLTWQPEAVSEHQPV